MSRAFTASHNVWSRDVVSGHFFLAKRFSVYLAVMKSFLACLVGDVRRQPLSYSRIICGLKVNVCDCASTLGITGQSTLQICDQLITILALDRV